MLRKKAFFIFFARRKEGKKGAKVGINWWSKAINTANFSFVVLKKMTGDS